MHVGFIHGVMNTDNMAVSGETIDFGPCAFMDSYDPAAVFSSIDQQGRYAYGNQPHAGVWNLARFAETLLPIIDADADRAVELASEVIATFSARFAEPALAGLRRKLGLAAHEDGDAALGRRIARCDASQSGGFHSDFPPAVRCRGSEAGDARRTRLYLRIRGNTTSGRAGGGRV